MIYFNIQVFDNKYSSNFMLRSNVVVASSLQYVS